jgi:hypothetical protein
MNQPPGDQWPSNNPPGTEVPWNRGPSVGLPQPGAGMPMQQGGGQQMMQQQLIQRILQMLMQQRGQQGPMPGQGNPVVPSPQVPPQLPGSNWPRNNPPGNESPFQRNPSQPSGLKAQQAQGDTFTVSAPNGAKVKLTKKEFADYNANKDSFWLDYKDGKYSH